MLTTIRAVVRGNRIEWIEDGEHFFPVSQSVEVLITPLQAQAAPLPAERSKRRLDALKKLAAINAFHGIAEPSQWQREMRTERDLPGRTS
jgi:hypothetical protein